MKNNIGYFRKANGLSMQELAQLAGTSQQQIDRLEKGQRRLTAEWMEKLSTALGCKPTELVVFSSSEAKPTKVETAIAKVIGAIETKFSGNIREFDADEQYDITFKPAKKDHGKKFFALVVDGGAYKGYPDGSELIFSRGSTSLLNPSLNENAPDFITSSASQKLFQFKIGKEMVDGHLVKSIRSE